MAKNPKSQWETITPKRAVEYLESNTRNRKVRARTVSFYARHIAEGEWEPNGESIIFAEDGTLLDGQHRLLACVEAGKSFKTLVVRGCSNDAFLTIDQSIPRSAGDIVGLSGQAHANRKAAAARVILRVLEAEPKGIRPQLSTKSSHKEVLDCVQQYEALLNDGCVVVRNDDGTTICRPPAVFTGCYVLFARKNRKKADEFFSLLTTGEGLSKNHPIMKLRGTLIVAATMPNVKRKKSWVLALTIKAWNFFLQGKSVGNLKFSDKESWPKIRAR